MTDELDSAILDNATGPRKASGDAGSMEQHSLIDQIAASKHLAAKSAAKKPAAALRFAKFVASGSV